MLNIFVKQIKITDYWLWSKTKRYENYCEFRQLFVSSVTSDSCHCSKNMCDKRVLELTLCLNNDKYHHKW